MNVSLASLKYAGVTHIAAGGIISLLNLFINGQFFEPYVNNSVLMAALTSFITILFLADIDSMKKNSRELKGIYPEAFKPSSIQPMNIA